MGAALWMINEKKLELQREIYEDRVERIPIKNNPSMMEFVVMDIADYSEIIRGYEEACLK
jgi:hypothetical protein